MKKPSLSSGIVFLQRVDEKKKEQARALRKSPTPAEKKLWNYLRGNKISGVKFRRQQIIEGFIVDFFCHKAKLVVEVDGDVHDVVEQKTLDTRRKEVFIARGLKEVRFRNEEVLGDVTKVVGIFKKLVDSRVNGR